MVCSILLLLVAVALQAAGTKANLQDPPTALCNSTVCQAGLPGCAAYRSVGEGNFGARRFYCESCSNTTVAVKTGVTAQFYQMSGGLPKVPIAVCTDRLSVTEIFKAGELPNCLYYYNQTNLSALVVTFYCAECAKGFVPAELGVNLTLVEYRGKNNASLATQTVCEIKKLATLPRVSELLITTVLILLVLLR